MPFSLCSALFLCNSPMLWVATMWSFSLAYSIPLWKCITRVLKPPFLDRCLGCFHCEAVRHKLLGHAYFCLQGTYIFTFMVSGIAGSQGTHMLSLIDKVSRFPKGVYQSICPSFPPLPKQCVGAVSYQIECFGGRMVLSVF